MADLFWRNSISNPDFPDVPIGRQHIFGKKMSIGKTGRHFSGWAGGRERFGVLTLQRGGKGTDKHKTLGSNFIQPRRFSF